MFKILNCAYYRLVNEVGSLSHIEPIHSHDELMIDLDAGWESRYFSEGRDALDGKSLWTGALSLGYNHFSGGVWYGRSSSHNYDELQYNLSLSEKLVIYLFTQAILI